MATSTMFTYEEDSAVPVTGIVNPAYLLSRCQGRQETFILLLLCCGHDDKVILLVQYP